MDHRSHVAQKVDYLTAGGVGPDTVAVNQVVIKLPTSGASCMPLSIFLTNELLHIALSSPRNGAVAHVLHSDLHEKRHLDAAAVLVDSAP